MGHLRVDSVTVAGRSFVRRGRVSDDDAIERAYRERVKRAHPDQGGSLEEFQLVRRAYRTLTEDRPNGGSNGDRTDVTDIDLDDERAAISPDRVDFLDYEVFVDRGWRLDNDDDLFAKASDADLRAAEYGRLLVDPDESLLEAAENRGFTWPFSCSGGACANCAVYFAEGELSQPANTILSSDHAEQGFRLSCNGYPVSDELKIVFNVKHPPELDELRLLPGPFRRAQSR